MNQKKMGHIVGNTFGDNTNFQGDHVEQKVEINNGNSEEMFLTLSKEIAEIKDETQRNMANFIAEQLKEASTKKDKTNAQKAFDALKNAIGVTASLTTIAKFIGLSI